MQNDSEYIYIYYIYVINRKLLSHVWLFVTPYTIQLEKAMAPYTSTLAWKIPWMEKPGRLQSMGSLRVGHDWATSLSLFTFMHWRRKRQPTPMFLPGESQGRGAWWAAISGVAESQTWLKRLSSRSSSRSRLYNPWNFPGQNTVVGSHSLLQGISPTQGLNPGLPYSRQIL